MKKAEFELKMAARGHLTTKSGCFVIIARLCVCVCVYVMDKSSHPHAAHIGGKFKNKIRRRPCSFGRPPPKMNGSFIFICINYTHTHTHTQAVQRRPLLTRPPRINKPATAAWQDIGPTPPSPPILNFSHLVIICHPFLKQNSTEIYTLSGDF